FSLGEHERDAHDNYQNVTEICVQRKNIDNDGDKSCHQQEQQRYKNVIQLHLDGNCSSLAHFIYLDNLIIWPNLKKLTFHGIILSHVLLEIVKCVLNTIKSIQLGIVNFIELFDTNHIELELVENIIITVNSDDYHPITIKFIEQLRHLSPRLEKLHICAVRSLDEALLINGLTLAGGNGESNGINQLSNPLGLYVNDDQTIYIADRANHRIVEWQWDATTGQVVAGGNGQGSGTHQLSHPLDVIVDKERDSLIICDYSNRRVVRWPRRNGTSGETIISNIDCVGLTMDENGSLYVVDNGKDEVRRYRRGESQGTVIAGGNGSGNRLDQLSYPRYVFVDRDHSVYVSDLVNHRVMKWVEGAKQGIVVAGGQGS
ncbi:unnamed protein product, partial [Didymodactylos carnosus]